MLEFNYLESSRTRSKLTRLRRVEKCLMIMMIVAAIALPVVALSQYLGPTEQSVYTSVADVLAESVYLGDGDFDDLLENDPESHPVMLDLFEPYFVVQP